MRSIKRGLKWMAVTFFAMPFVFFLMIFIFTGIFLSLMYDKFKEAIWSISNNMKMEFSSAKRTIKDIWEMRND